MSQAYGKIAGIDVHKKWLFTVIPIDGVADRKVPRIRTMCRSGELAALRDWLLAAGVQTVVMESTANYWKPVFAALEGYFRVLVAQAQSNKGPRGRKSDYVDAIRLARRLAADELRLSFVPEAEQRSWRLLTRTRARYTDDIVEVRNRLEGILEDARIKLSDVVSDLIGGSGRRIVRAMADGDTDPQKLAALGDRRLRVSREELAEALNGKLTDAHSLLLRQTLDQIEALEKHIAEIEQDLDAAMSAYKEVLARLCTLPGVSITAAREIVAEFGPEAKTFPTAACACSWVGTCPGSNESAGKVGSTASAKGNRSMRRVMNQCAWAAIRTKDSYLQHLFNKLKARLGPNKAAWAIANRLVRLVWKILHEGVRYEERGPKAADPKYLKRMLERCLRQLRMLGITAEVTIQEGAPA